MFIVFFLAGIAVGSFLNVIIDRLPEGKSIVTPPSHCSACGQRLTAIDLIPLISYLRLRGHCRYCGARIPQRIIWIEFVTGLAFALLWWKYGTSAEMGVLDVYACLFIVLFIIDLDHGLILNKLVYPACIFALATVPLRPELTIVDSLIGGCIGFAILFAIALASRGGMGMGDVKMIGLIGLATGFPVIFVALFISIVLGGLAAIGFILFGLKKRRDTLPFGPFLAVGAMTALLWGNTIWNWYTSPFG